MNPRLLLSLTLLLLKSRSVLYECFFGLYSLLLLQGAGVGYGIDSLTNLPWFLAYGMVFLIWVHISDGRFRAGMVLEYGWLSL